MKPRSTPKGWRFTSNCVRDSSTLSIQERLALVRCFLDAPARSERRLLPFPNFQNVSLRDSGVAGNVEKPLPAANPAHPCREIEFSSLCFGGGDYQRSEQYSLTVAALHHSLPPPRLQRLSSFRSTLR